ncbi:MAG: ATP-binding protein, partial [Planctomycetota bacterium]
RLDDPAAVNELCDRLGRDAKWSSTRYTVVRADGTVLGDSEKHPVKDNMDNHGRRPEIVEAFRTTKGYGSSVRHSDTVDKDMMYVAVRIPGPGGAPAVARVSLPVTVIAETVRSIYRHVALGGAVVALLAILTCFWVSRTLSRPLEEMERTAEQFAAGDLSARVPVPDTFELAGLGETLNAMAADLDRRIQAIVRQRNEQEAILASMSEGVLAIDVDEQIISMNRTAGRMLGVEVEQARGRTIQEVIRNPELQKFVANALRSPDPTRGDVAVRDGQEKLLETYSASLRGPDDGAIGVVIVMNDVTRVRRLENLRRDFVANVSHELKTPITSIKGFVETLVDGAVDDREEAERFLRIVAGHADRLTAIIDDLLLLSRIEQDEQEPGIGRETWPLADILASAVRACEQRAAEKGTPVTLDCPDDLTAEVNAQLFEQAVTNLIDNAIKYSEPGSAIEVTGSAADGEVAVSVRDHGCGIEAKHLPRVFERFYRVDKARSRSLGGTGLGLAIVKHIVRAHQGRVTVDSTPGEGSAFTIFLPVPGAPEAEPGSD